MGLYIFIAITILYFTGVTCLSILIIDNERFFNFSYEIMV